MRYRFGLAYLIFFLAAALLLQGCESGDNIEVTTRPSSQPEGVIQSRVDENGVTHIALGLAPKKPGGEAPDLSELRKMDLFDRGAIP